MLRLIESSNPDDVTRFNVRAQCYQRLVLTAAVCRELGPATRNDIVAHRVQAALELLSWWMREVYDLPAAADVEYKHGLDDPQLTQFADDLQRELQLGSSVCDVGFPRKSGHG